MGVFDTKSNRFAGPAVAAVLLVFSAGSPAHAQDDARIGIAAPLSGYFSIIGEQIEAGAMAALQRRADVTHRVADDQCSEDDGARSARELADAGVSVVIGYPCIEALDSALPVLADAGIAVIAIGVQAELVAEQDAGGTGQVLRLAPKAAHEADAIATYLRDAWRDANFAIIDDGTLYGRQLAETVRFLLKEDNLRPVFTDTYRPQIENQAGLVRRLQRAGATHVLVGGDAFDAAVIARNAEAIGIPLTLAGGSALVAPPSAGKLSDGTLVAKLPDWSVRDAAAGIAAELATTPVGTDGYVLPAYAAAEIAIFGADIADGNGGFPRDRMTGRTFETAIGPIRFDENGDVTRNLFEVFVVRDGELTPAAAGPQEAIQ